MVVEATNEPEPNAPDAKASHLGSYEIVGLSLASGSGDRPGGGHSILVVLHQ